MYLITEIINELKKGGVTKSRQLIQHYLKGRLDLETHYIKTGGTVQITEEGRKKLYYLMNAEKLLK